MRIGKVVGMVTSNRIHPLLQSGQLKIVVPFTLKDLTSSAGRGTSSGEKEGKGASKKGEPDSEGTETSKMWNLLVSGAPTPTGEELVAYDELSVGIGEWVAFSEGAEAAMPFYPDVRPIDVYIGAIIDSVEIDQKIFDSVVR